MPMFITFCCKVRNRDSLANPAAWESLTSACEILHKAGKLRPRVMLAMPDHVHLLATIPADGSIKMVVRSLKTAVARNHEVAWQDGFFDHRARSDWQAAAIADYILANPSRSGLVKKGGSWPFVRTSW